MYSLSIRRSEVAYQISHMLNVEYNSLKELFRQSLFCPWRFLSSCSETFFLNLKPNSDLKFVIFRGASATPLPLFCSHTFWRHLWPNTEKRNLFFIIKMALDPWARENFNSFCTYMLFAGWEVRMVKNCDRGLENAARGRRPRAAFSRPRSQSFIIRTDP